MPAVHRTPGVVDKVHHLVSVGSALFVVWVSQCARWWCVTLLDMAVKPGRVGVVVGVESAFGFFGPVCP